MKTTSLLLASLGLSLLACRGGGGGGGGDDVNPPDMPPGGQVHIQDVQNDSMPKGTAVSLKGVVVTAIDAFGARTGDLWIEEPGGGEFSGVKVFGAPLDQVAQLAPGDIVDVTNAEKDEFALSTDPSGRTVTELKGAAGGMMTITKTGTGTVPAAETVDAVAIDALPDQPAKDAEWEKWEGVLINVTNLGQLSDVTTFGTAEDQKKFTASGDLVVESVMADLGTAAVVGTCYSSVNGIGDYFFDHLLLPRMTGDLVAGGSGCAATPDATIAEIQSGAKTGTVVVKDVFVVAISFNKKNLWVATSLSAAPSDGIFVFRGNGAAELDASIVPGAKVTINGTVKEQNNDTTGDTLTQLQSATVTFGAAPAGPPTANTSQQDTVSALLDNTTGEPFESVLVTLKNVKVNSVGDSTNFFVGELQQGATKFLSDDDIFRLPTAEVNKCYASITGIWTYQVFSNAYGLLPLAVGTGTGTCQ
jgi:hypothetical protein